jgi:hypothetical protein
MSTVTDTTAPATPAAKSRHRWEVRARPAPAHHVNETWQRGGIPPLTAVVSTEMIGWGWMTSPGLNSGFLSEVVMTTRDGGRIEATARLVSAEADAWREAITLLGGDPRIKDPEGIRWTRARSTNPARVQRALRVLADAGLVLVKD